MSHGPQDMGRKRAAMRRHGATYRAARDEAGRVALWRLRNPEKYQAQMARASTKRKGAI